MTSMIKREVNVSITAHVDMITQLVLDTHELHLHRFTKRGRRDQVFSPGCMLYHRMSRQTGHTAALKKLLSYEFQTNNNLFVMGVFHTSQERDNALRSTRDVVTGKEFPAPDIDKKEHTTTIKNWIGTKICDANIIVFSDTLHDPERLSAAMDMLRNNTNAFPNLTLVVFLG